MKQLLSAIVFFAAYVHATAQCSDCRSLREALKDPSRVRHLDLSNQGLTRLPDSLQYMTQLETIDLSQNFFTIVDLGNAQLPQVWKLDLSGNIGLDPLKLETAAAAFPNLLNLDISDAKIAYLTPEIAAFKQLISLDLSGNDLLFLPEELKAIRSLHTLDIRGNKITDITYVLSNCWNLRKLNAAGNPFDPDALLISVSMARLDELAYSYTEPGREGARVLAELQVRSLELIGINGDGLPAALAKNRSVSHLTLTDCRFSKDIVPVLGAMSGLDKLTLNNTPLPEKLSKADNISSLELANIPYPTNAALAELEFLDELDVTGVDVPDSVTQALPSLLPETSIRTGYYNYAPEMVDNAVPAIRIPEATEQQIPGDQPVQVVVENIAFDVPQNAFLNADGSVYNGPVTLKVTNYDNAITNALAGAPMIMENNGQQEVFASSGMLDFRATDTQGNELKANSDNQIQVTMANQRPDQPVNLYTFDPATNQWYEQQTTPAAISVDSLRAALIDSVNRLDLESFLNFQSVPTLLGLKIKDKRWDPSLLAFTSYNHKPGYDANRLNASVRYYERNCVSRVITNRQWRIDTIVTPQLAAKLQEIQCAQKIPKKIKDPVRYDNQPRLIQDLTVRPDFANDNYRMSFRFKDTLIDVPVFIETNKPQGRRMMREYAKFQQSVDRAAKKDKKEEKLYVSRKKSGWEKEAEARRSMVVAGIMNNSFSITASAGNSLITGTYTAPLEQLRFGLSSFGLVNCDFFSRNQPDQYAGLSEIMTDQNGEELKAPEFVRTVLPKSNVYLSSYRTNIPQYKNEPTILLLLISATELGVVKVGSLAEQKISSFRRINIEGKSSEEVRKLINL
jgi:Leucine-rich repeat (LRR) protein